MEFTAKQKEIVARKMGYDGPMQMFDEFLSASPSDAQRYSAITSKFAEKMAKGGMVKRKGYAVGGNVPAPASAAPSEIGQPVMNIAGTNYVARTTTITPEMKAAAATAAPVELAKTTNIAAPAAVTAPTVVTAKPVTAVTSAEKVQRALDGTKTPLPTNQDASDAMKYIAGTSKVTPEALKKYDWNRDGKIDLTDTINLLKLSSGMETSTPMPDDMDWGKTRAGGAAQGEVSEEAQVEAAQGVLSEGALAAQQKVGEQFITPVTAGTRTTQDGELVTAVTEAPTVAAQAAQAAAPTAVQAAQGVVRAEELVQPAQIAEKDMAQATAITAEGLAPDARVVAARLDAFTVDAGTLAQAAQGNVDAQATVQGQLASLMKSFDDGQTPAWAAGAIRAANAAMAARGMGGSSLAATAIFQAAMESALPIAAQDAQVFQQMGMQNLNNRQQVALANAAAQQGLQLQNLSNEQQARLQNAANSFSLQSQNLSNMQQTMLANTQIRAALQGQNLSNQQQAAVVNAARYAEMANINLNNIQQAALHNSSMQIQVDIANASNRQQAALANAQIEAAMQGKILDNKQQAAVLNATRIAENLNTTFNAQQQAALNNSQLMKDIGVANLSAAQQTTIANAATLASMDMANLNNRQQAAVENARAFLQMDMANLSNEQQMNVIKAQAITQAVLSDTAAQNAAAITNATNALDADKLNAQLATSVQQFNVAEKTKVDMANAAAANSLAQFNAQQANARAEFNANMATQISVANAKLLAEISTANTAAINAAQAVNAKNATDLNTAQYNAQMQVYRDLLETSWKTGESEKDRYNKLAEATITASASSKSAQITADNASVKTIGDTVSKVLTSDAFLNWALGPTKK